MSRKTAEMVQHFLRAKTSAGRRAKTLEKYHSQLGRFADMFSYLPTMPAQIDRFLGGIEGEPETKDTYYRTLSSFYGWLARRHYIRENPVVLVEAPLVLPKAPRVLEPAELATLLTHGAHSDRDRALLYFLTDTGARIGEAANLRVDDLRDGYVLLAGKTGQRFAPLSAQVSSMILRLRRGHSRFVWQGRLGPLTQGALVHIVKDAFRRAGFVGHDLTPLLVSEASRVQLRLQHTPLVTCLSTNCGV